MEDGRIHDRARHDLDAPGLQMHVHRVQHQPSQIVLLQQVTEAQDRRLIRRRRHAEIDAHEPPQRRGLIQRLLHPCPVISPLKPIRSNAFSMVLLEM